MILNAKLIYKNQTHEPCTKQIRRGKQTYRSEVRKLSLERRLVAKRNELFVVGIARLDRGRPFLV